MHLYEGFIARDDAGFWRSGLNMLFQKSKAAEVSDAWQASARTLLDRIFQAWTPSDKQSTLSLCDSLVHFTRSLGSAHTRMTFPDSSHPPVVLVGHEATIRSNTPPPPHTHQPRVSV